MSSISKSRSSYVIIKVFCSLIDAQVNCLKNIIKIYIKINIKQLRHVSVQSHHHQGAHYSNLLKLRIVKIAN